uniref:Uncharacterized protein n=1 Tax=Pipistrellus kuhlii TaxID=59472 RepID=A0A7J7Y908_PIPKU|nr:hypothetical protein mPipKuh1_010279 [Pipistrellus kuhlii]
MGSGPSTHSRPSAHPPESPSKSLSSLHVPGQGHHHLPPPVPPPWSACCPSCPDPRSSTEGSLNNKIHSCSQPSNGWRTWEKSQCLTSLEGAAPSPPPTRPLLLPPASPSGPLHLPFLLSKQLSSRTPLPIAQ